MKTTALILGLLVSQVAMASGGFYCYDAKKEYSVQAVTSHMVGSPIAQAVKIKAGGTSFDVPVERVAQYKQNQATLYALGISEDFRFLAFELETYANRKSGVLMGRLIVRYLSGEKVVEQSKSVTCEVE